MALRSDVQKGFDSLVTSINSNFRLYKESLEAGFSTINRDHDIVVSEEQLGSVIHHVLSSQILSRVEESLAAKSESQNAATLRHIRTTIDDATGQILKHIDQKMSNSNVSGSREKSKSEEPIPDTQNFASPGAVYRPPTRVSSLATKEDYHCSSMASPNFTPVVSAIHPSKLTEWSYWTSIPRVGSFQIGFQVHVAPSGRFWTIKMDFWPSIIPLVKRCISLKYSSCYDRQGYIALCPALAMYPILSDNDAIWQLITHDDVTAIRSRFDNRQNSPFDQDNHGESLLMVSFSSTANFGSTYMDLVST